MEFGLFMMPLHPPHRALADGYDRDVDQIVLADRLGYREAWIGEHFTERSRGSAGRSRSPRRRMRRVGSCARRPTSRASTSAKVARPPRATLAPVYAWFTEGHDTADLCEARAVLDALA